MTDVPSDMGSWPLGQRMCLLLLLSYMQRVHFTLLPAPGGQFSCWSHFVDENVEAEEDQMIYPDSQLSQWV